ncbi:MAG: carbohydrate-binding domain-containing protein, partial [Bacillota bacterium]|nr:carbohydrate-binding domain-containing protein [Bacillota bacterium]
MILNNELMIKRTPIRRAAVLLAALILCLSCMTGCGSEDTTQQADASGDYDFTYSDRDLDPSYDEGDATMITLEDSEISVDGKGASAEGSTLSIESEGTYIVSGVLSDGQITIETDDTEKVQLVLNGVDIACSDNAPILIKESDKVFITLAPESQNTLTGPDAYSAEATEDSIDGVILSRADLCINGSGGLTVTTASGHGIVSKDDLIITGGSYSIITSGDGLQGKDCVKIKDGTFAIEADNDGIKSNNAEDADRGFVSIDGGVFNITAGYDGIQAETLLRVADGNLTITTGGGSAYASTQSDWGSSWGGGAAGQPPGATMGPGGDSSSDSSTDSTSDSVSAKGLKGNLGVTILDGTVTIDSSDDSIHSNGDVQIDGGTMNISSGDDGMHADSDLTVNGGKITITQSYEGIEGNTITLNDGIISLVASDDGLNAAGGNDGSSTDDRAGADDFAVDETAFIEINGGTLEVDASGDGIDSNGDLTVTGGNIYVSGPVNDGNGTLDYAGEASVDGGVIVAAGSSGMAQGFGSGSAQCSLLYGFGSSQSAGSEVSLVDSSGKTIASYSPSKTYTSVIFSSSDMAEG